MHLRLIQLALIPSILLLGCSANLQAVREFADETNKIGIAFEPVLGHAVEHCKQKFLQRRIYTTDVPLDRFDPASAVRQAGESCQAVADKNSTARGMSRALSAYAAQLSLLAADGVATSFDDDFDSLASKLDKFDELPKEQVGAISNLLKFITRNIVVKSQRDAIEEALAHDLAVGALADALVMYSDRVYGAYLTERLRDQQLFAEVLRSETATPISSRLRLMDLHQQTLALDEQKKAIENLRAAVTQMKISMRDLKQNLDKLSARERLDEVGKLAKEVRALYRQLDKAF